MPGRRGARAERGAEASEPGQGTIGVVDCVKEFEGGVLAVDHVSFEAEPGEFVSLVGPSGCGKSTLLRLIAGLIPLTAGTISVNGREVVEPRQDVALMFQRPMLLPWQTALQNALLPRKLRGRAGAEASEREAYELLDLVGLFGFEHTYPRHLSGGMQQRVALELSIRLMKPDDPERIGDLRPEVWEAGQDVLFRAGILEEKGDVAGALNDELIEEINDFDRAAVERAADKWEG